MFVDSALLLHLPFIIEVLAMRLTALVRMLFEHSSIKRWHGRMEGERNKQSGVWEPTCTISELNFVSKWAARSASTLSSRILTRSWYCCATETVATVTVIANKAENTCLPKLGHLSARSNNTSKRHNCGQYCTPISFFNLSSLSEAKVSSCSCFWIASPWLARWAASRYRDCVLLGQS